MLQLPTGAELNLFPILPAIIVATGMCLLLLIDLWIPDDEKNRTAWLAQGTIVTAFFVNLFTFNAPAGQAAIGMFVADRATAFLNAVTLMATFIAILMSMDYLKRTGMERGEFYSLILFAASGAMFMASANDLVVIFVALELLSIPLYIMAAFRYQTFAVPDDEDAERKSQEAGMKYFLLGAFASAFFVYGAALVYGGAGTTNLTEIFQAVSLVGEAGGYSTTLMLFGAGLILVGLGFKIAVFPFHMWTPDVYEGAPTNVTAFMSIVAKVGGVAALARIMVTGLPLLVIGAGDNAAWQLAVGTVALLTMVIGNFIAILQDNMKRMLAYSSVAHGGYMLMAIAAAGTLGATDEVLTAVAVYLMAYTFTNLGAFAVVMAIEKNNGKGTEIEDFVGLGKSEPGLAILMTIFMLSLVGIPATGGFIGKYFVFAAAVRAELYLLASVGILTSLASVYYYMRPVVNMYLRDDADGEPAVGATPYLKWAIYASAAGVLLIGIFPALATSLLDGLTVVASTGF